MAKVRCANCERTLGNLEDPMELGDRLVCADCHRRLTAVSEPPPLPALPQMAAYPQPAAPAAAAYAPQQVAAAAPRRVQTIERTGKGWKLMLLLSMVAMVWGVVWFMMELSATSASGMPNDSIAFAVLLFVGGLLLAIVARIGAWWFHG